MDIEPVDLEDVTPVKLDLKELIPVELDTEPVEFDELDANKKKKTGNS